VPTVCVEPEGIEVVTRPGECILGALNRSGYGYRIGCRRGGCGVCMVDLVSGEVEYAVTVSDKVLSDADKDGGSCLSCRAIPVRDVVIRLRNDRLRCTSTLLASMAGVRRTTTAEGQS
jgi:ferredoxin